MTPISLAAPSVVLILKSSRLLGSVLREVVQDRFAAATIHVANTLAEGRLKLDEQPIDLLVTGVGFPDGDALEVIAQQGERRRILVVTSHWEHRVLAALRVLPIRGVFDPSSEDAQQLDEALEAVAQNGHYWSLSVLDRLYAQSVPSTSISRMLSPTEHLVFAVIGDGTDDKAAATELNLRPSTVQSVRRDLHRKLGAQHKGDLMRLAVQYGYVRITAGGVQRLGFASLLAARHKAELCKAS
jgi:DNA-binding NarL/FixJ family response regulator